MQRVRAFLARWWRWIAGAAILIASVAAVVLRRTPAGPSPGSPVPPTPPPGDASLPSVPVVSPDVQVEPAAPLTLPEIVVQAPVPVPAVTVPTVEVVLPAPAVVTISGEVTQAHCEVAVARLRLDWRWALALARIESAADGMVGREALTRTEVHVFRRRLPAARHREAGRLITDGVRGRTNVEVHAWSRRWLSEATQINREAAYASCSYGAWQVMGFHHLACGFATAEGMVAAFDEGLQAQAMGLNAFLTASPSLVRAMQIGDWPAVGVAYNGPGNGNQVDGRPNPQSAYNQKLRAELRALGFDFNLRTDAALPGPVPLLEVRT